MHARLMGPSNSILQLIRLHVMLSSTIPQQTITLPPSMGGGGGIILKRALNDICKMLDDKIAPIILLLLLLIHELQQQFPYSTIVITFYVRHPRVCVQTIRLRSSVICVFTMSFVYSYTINYPSACYFN